MSDENPSNGTPPVVPKPKRPMNEAQRAALAKGQAALAERRAAKKAAQAAGLVQTSSAEIREVQNARAAAPPPVDPDTGEVLDEAPPSRTNGKPALRSIADVVHKLHESEAAASLPTVEQAARQTRLYTVGADPLPPPEENPHLNDGIVASSGAPDLVGVQAPKNLADLMNQAPTIGDGQYYIEVVRRAPQQYGGVICKGTQRPIREYMTDTDFVSFYGGGDYTLTLYGPPPRGGMVDARTGRMRHKALSPPVKLEISPSVYPPNVQAAVLHDDETQQTEGDDNMRYMHPGFSPGGAQPMRPTTTADARMLEVQLEHEDKERLRQEAREREIRDERAGVTASLSPMLDVVHRNTLESVKVVERHADQQRRASEDAIRRAEAEKLRAEERADKAEREAKAEIERARDRPTDAAAMVDGFAKMAGVLRPPESANAGQLAAALAEAKALNAALDSARQEVQRITKAHSDEVTRIQDKHATELRRLQDEHREESTRRTDQERKDTERLDRQHADELKRLEERLKEHVDRAERRAEETERKAEQRVTEAETRAERRLGELREEQRRALDDLRTQNQQRLDDERRQHDRDMKSQASTYETRLAGQKDMFDNRLTTVGGEITRLAAESERYRKEAEENKDIAKHIERAEAAASALGWAPAESAGNGELPPPKDWKEMLGRVGMELVQKFPEIVQSAGETVSKLRGQPGPTPEQVQAMQYDAMMANAQNTLARQMAGGAPMAPVNLPPPMRARDGSLFQPTQQLRFGTEDWSGPVDPNAPPPHAAYEHFAPPPTAPAPPPQYAPPQYAGPQYAPQPQQTYAPQPQQQQYAPQPQQTYAQSAQVPMPQAPGQTYQPQGGPPPLPPAQPQQQAAPEQQMQIPQAPPGSVPTVIPSEMIIQFAPVLEQALASGEPLDSIARELVELLGRDNLARVVHGLKPERVVVELQKAGRKDSPLVRRQGQQFLRDLWQHAGVALQQR